MSSSSDEAATAAASSSSDPQQHHHSLSLAYQTYMRHDDTEREHMDNVCRSFRQYATFALCHWENQTKRMLALDSSQRQLLPLALVEGTSDHQQRAFQFRDAAIRNQFCLDCILKHAGVPHSQETKKSETTTNIADDSQVSKVSSVLKSLAREWSKDGKAERDMAFAPILEAIQQCVPVKNEKKVVVPRICVPGAGVGRLAWELSALGYEVQGNEFSLHMLLASDFVLNGTMCSTERPLAISPWLLESRNVHSATDPCRKILIPDVDPVTMIQGNDDETETTHPTFSMAAGDFCSIYSNPNQLGQWEAVACCFFLDAAPNMIEYIQVIYDMLAEGGVLISFGPLLYHWSGPAMRPDDSSYEDYQKRFAHLDKRYMESIDLCWEDIREILLNVGFVLEEERVGRHALYTADRRSMMNMSYRCVNFVARKQSTSNDHVAGAEAEVPSSGDDGERENRESVSMDEAGVSSSS